MKNTKTICTVTRRPDGTKQVQFWEKNDFADAVLERISHYTFKSALEFVERGFADYDGVEPEDYEQFDDWEREKDERSEALQRYEIDEDYKGSIIVIPFKEDQADESVPYLAIYKEADADWRVKHAKASDLYEAPRNKIYEKTGTLKDFIADISKGEDLSEKYLKEYL